MRGSKTRIVSGRKRSLNGVGTQVESSGQLRKTERRIRISSTQECAGTQGISQKTTKIIRDEILGEKNGSHIAHAREGEKKNAHKRERFARY